MRRYRQAKNKPTYWGTSEGNYTAGGKAVRIVLAHDSLYGNYTYATFARTFGVRERLSTCKKLVKRWKTRTHSKCYRGDQHSAWCLQVIVGTRTELRQRCPHLSHLPQYNVARVEWSNRVTYDQKRQQDVLWTNWYQAFVMEHIEWRCLTHLSKFYEHKNCSCELHVSWSMTERE